MKSISDYEDENFRLRIKIHKLHNAMEVVIRAIGEHWESEKHKRMYIKSKLEKALEEESCTLY